MAVVAVTDHVFPDLDQERAILSGAGHELRFERNAATVDEVVAAVAGADAVLNCYARMPADVIRTLDRCRIIARYGIGLDTIDMDAASERGIVVTNVPDYCIDEVSDHALALALGLARGVALLDRRVRMGSWTPTDARPLHRIRGRTFGLVGFGRIAQALAVKAAALGFRVVATDPYVPDDAVLDAGVEPLSLDELLARADVVSLHVPLTDESHHLIGPEALAKMKPAAILVNTSRGPLVDTSALHDALDSGRLGGAALDVLEQEPPAPDDPLLQRDDVVITPHTGFYSEESLRELQRKAVEQVVEALAGRRPPVRGQRRRHWVRYLDRRGGPPPTTPAPDLDGKPERPLEDGRRQDLVDRPGRDESTVPEQRGMGARGRHLLEMVRRYDRRRPVVRGGGLERGDQRFASGEIQPRGRLVEDQQLWCGEQRPSEEDPLPFALTPRRKPTPDEMTASELSEQVLGAPAIVLAIPLEPGRERHTLAREHHRLGDQIGRHQLRQDMAGVADPTVESSDIASPKRGSEHADTTLRRLPACARDAQQRGLAAPVWSEEHPTLVEADHEVERPEDRPALDAHDRAVELDDRFEVRHR